MKKIIGVLVLGVFLLSIVAAVEVVVVDKPNTFTGAILKVGSSEEKIYPKVPVIGGGIAKFDVSSTSEAKITIIFTKSGEVLEDKTLVRGPYDFTKNITINLEEERKGNSTENISAIEDVVEINETIEEGEDVENESVEKESKLDSVTGKAVVDGGIIKGVWMYIGGGLIIAIIAVFFIVKMAYVSGAKSASRVIGRVELDRRLDQLN